MEITDAWNPFKKPPLRALVPENARLASPIGFSSDTKRGPRAASVPYAERERKAQLKADKRHQRRVDSGMVALEQTLMAFLRQAKSIQMTTRELAELAGCESWIAGQQLALLKRGGFIQNEAYKVGGKPVTKWWVP